MQGLLLVCESGAYFEVCGCGAYFSVHAPWIYVAALLRACNVREVSPLCVCGKAKPV